jgi:hypothetical protein
VMQRFSVPACRRCGCRRPGGFDRHDVHLGHRAQERRERGGRVAAVEARSASISAWERIRLTTAPRCRARSAAACGGATRPASGAG